MRRSRSRSWPAVIVLLAVLAASSPASAATWVSYPALLEQVRSGPLIRAIINPARGDVEIKFANLSEWHAFYPRADQLKLQRLLDARHIRVLFVPRHQPAAAKPAAVHHHLRYIAAAVIAACTLSAGAYLVWRRRSRSHAAASRPVPDDAR
jgi:hypothetical protein